MTGGDPLNWFRTCHFSAEIFFSVGTNYLIYQWGLYEPSSLVKLKNSMLELRLQPAYKHAQTNCPFRFYDLVMIAPANGSQPVLQHLQQTFAFLRHSMRSIYSPAEFIKAARPPWFEVGRQQDCSEFLRFVLTCQSTMIRSNLT